MIPRLNLLKEKKKASPNTKKKTSNTNEENDPCTFSNISGPNTLSINSCPSNSDPSSSLNVNPNNIISTPYMFSNIASGSNQFSSPNIPIINHSTHVSPNAMTNNTPSQLIVVPPKKTIFAARFSDATTEENVSSYIKQKLNSLNKCPPNIDINVFKFKYTERRSKSSFKIIVSEDIFDIIVDPYFWPDKAIIREYIYKPNAVSDIVDLPYHLSNVSKN